MNAQATSTFVRRFEHLTNDDTDIVGGKNASLGEMIGALQTEGVRVPSGFATTADAYREFLQHNEIEDSLREQIDRLHQSPESLKAVGTAIRDLFEGGEFPESVRTAIVDGYREFCSGLGKQEIAVAVRSSATAEDLPEASFAGQQETFLNVTGAEALVEACKKCYASLFTDRAISYREENGFDHLKVALSVGVQRMVRADRAGSGVMFSLDTETGFPDVIVISAAWGLGETVVQGTVNPDEYRVFKPLLDNHDVAPLIEKQLGAKAQKLVYSSSGNDTTELRDTPAEDRDRFVLTDEQILQLARWAKAIEAHYEQPMDMEWALDGDNGELTIVQARPETVQSQRIDSTLQTFRLTSTSEELVTGLAIGQRIATGTVYLLEDPSEADRFESGGVLVTDRTDPDWGPLMKRASAIVTNHGGRTSHAAIVSRELGLAAIVGTGDATEQLEDGQEVTVSCAQGARGVVYQGMLEFERNEIDPAKLPQPPVSVMMNLASPEGAFRWWKLPTGGVGLARMEFLINNVIKVHPLALTRFEELSDEQAREQIEALTAPYADRREYFIEKLARGVASIAAAAYPNPAIVRLSDFKTNEYAGLIGGRAFEPEEENPMLGFRGASRYYSEHYADGFALECQALLRAREHIGLSNIVVMVPFVRTIDEADQVLAVMAEHGLVRGQRGLKIYMMCEIPSNIFLAEEFAKRFDGFSIGSNDLTQLILGIDRDSDRLKNLFDERDAAVKTAVADVITRAQSKGCKVGICGQAPSDHPEFAKFLVDAGIDSISLNPDSIVNVIEHLS
jgi:pyruvate,water dikinase